MTPPQPATSNALRLTYAAALVGGAVAPIVPLMLGQRPSGPVGASGLLLIALGLLLRAAGPGTTAPRFGAPAIAAVPGLVMLGIGIGPILVVLLGMPLSWLGDVWSGVWNDTVLLPPGIVLPADLRFSLDQVLAMAIAATAAAVLAYTMRRTLGAAVGAFLVVVATAVPLALAATDAAWPAVPLALLGVGAVLVGAASIAPFGPWRRGVAGFQGFACLTGGTAASLATPSTTVLALALAAVLGVVSGFFGRAEARTPAAILSVLVGAAAADVAALAAGASRAQATFGVLAVAVTAVVVAAAVRATHRRTASATELTAHVVMIVATGLTVGSLANARLLCGIWTLAVVARVLWPGTSTSDRRFLASYAAVWAALTWCLLLGQPAQTLNEAYTLPFAVPLAIGGWAAQRRWRGLGPLGAYGPAALAAIAPTLWIAAGTGDWWRLLAVAVAVGAAGVAWSLRRRRASGQTKAA